MRSGAHDDRYGNDLRLAIGSVNAVEFFVTCAASATFLLSLGIQGWPIILGLALALFLLASLRAASSVCAP